MLTNDVDIRVLPELKYLFANMSTRDKDGIYPVTIAEIAEKQRLHRYCKQYFSDKSFKKRDPDIGPKVINDVKILVKENKKLVIPSTEMQSRIVQWYHHYLQHPGQNRLEETICAIMWWKGMQFHIRRHVKTCKQYQTGKKTSRNMAIYRPKLRLSDPGNRYV